MNAFAHVLKKDCRRLAVPLSLWTLVKGLAVLLHACQEPQWWQSAAPYNPGVPYTLGLLCTTVLYWVLTVILAAGIVLEDPPKGTTAFWLTRPFARGQVLAAKFCLLAVVAVLPVLLHLAGLAACGAGGPNLLATGLTDLLLTSCVTLAAAAFAVTAESFGQFAINAILILIGAGLVTAASAIVRQAHRQAELMADTYTPTANASLVFGVLILAVAVGFGIVFWRYWRRHARFVVAVTSLGALIPMQVAICWHWDFLARWDRPRPADRVVESNFPFPANAAQWRTEFAAAGSVGALETTLDPAGNVVVPLQVSHLEVSFVHGRNFSFAGPENLSLVAAQACDPIALARLVAPSVMVNLSPRTPLPIKLATITSRPAQWEPPIVRATVSGSVWHYEIVGEMPLAAGSRLVSGLRDAKITDVTLNGGKLTVSLREGEGTSLLAAAFEHGEETQTGPVQGFSTNANQRGVGFIFGQSSTATGPLYVLLNRSRREALLASEVTYLGMSDDESYRVDYNRLHFAGHGIDQQWMSQAVLLCVRLVRIGSVTGTADSSKVNFLPSAQPGPGPSDLPPF